MDNWERIEKLTKEINKIWDKNKMAGDKYWTDEQKQMFRDANLIGTLKAKVVMVWDEIDKLKEK